MEGKSDRFDFPSGYRHVRPENYENADKVFMPFLDDESQQMQAFSVVRLGPEPEFLKLDQLDDRFRLETAVNRNGGYVNYRPRLYKIKSGDVEMALVQKV